MTQNQPTAFLQSGLQTPCAIKLEFSPAVFDEIVADARACGMSVDAYVRLAVVAVLERARRA